MPTRWLPWPANRKASCPPVPVPVTVPGRVAFSARAWRPARSSARSAPTITARRSSTARPVARDQPTSATGRSSCAAAHVWSRPACAASACSSLAETTQGTSASGSLSGSVSSGRTGVSSMIMWALVPLNPKAETAARRGAS